MRLVCVLLALLTAVSLAIAQGPDDQYILIYNLIQEADSLSNADQPARALTKYLEAQADLQKLQKSYPDWNAKVVNFRMNYLGTKVGEVTRRVPAPLASAPASAAMLPASGAARPALTAPGAPAPPANWENQLQALQSQVRRLEDDKVALEAKLKEALSAQPARSDPRELARAEASIRALSKENDLLKVSLDQEKTHSTAVADAKALEQAQQALLQAKRGLTAQTQRADTLAKEKAALQAKLRNLPPSSFNAAEIESARKALESANRKLDDQTKLAADLAAEKKAMQARLTTLEADHEAASALRAENQLLRKTLDGLQATLPAAGKTNGPARELAQAQARVASLESEKEILRLEKLSLENRISQLSAATPRSPRPDDGARVKQLEQERNDLKNQLDTSARELKSARAEASAAATTSPTSKDSARFKKLQQERDELKQQLQAATKELNGRKGKIAAAHVLEMENQVAALRSRLDVFEARQVPYTSEELALFRKPEAKLAKTENKRGSSPNMELPPGTVALAAEAQRYYSAKQLDKAEDKYLQVVRQAQNNVPTLANLAAVELELNHLALAETNLQQALALAPEDSTCLLTLGHLRHRQGQYDAALDALSRAAKVEPRSAEIQNSLALTLSAKGLRGPAETALRKAVQLDPGYGEAQNNLAVIYATQQPPLVELARWHYQKALAAGSPPNANLERLLKAKQAAEGSHP
jgi:hypothetical protein